MNNDNYESKEDDLDWALANSVQSDEGSIKKKYDIKDYVAPEIVIPDFSSVCGIVLIVGSSGSGKSTILKTVNSTVVHIDENTPIINHFTSETVGEQLLIACGLRSVPTWFKNISQVSNGERHRAECAIAIHQGVNVIDEFTSVVDRNTAKSLSASLRKANNSDELLFVASCHRDIIEWLCPDYIYDTDLQSFIDRGNLRRPDIAISIKSTNYQDWEYFSKHHYLDSGMSKATHSYTAYIDGQAIAFMSVIHGCSRDIKTYWRDCRLVVLPEWQGLGIGTKFSNAIAKVYKDKGFRYFAKTAHPALGEHRENNKKWKATSTNKQARRSYLKKDGQARDNKGFGKTATQAKRDSDRVCYSHEYIGE